MARSTPGSELMQKINDGRLAQVPSAEIQKFRTAISTEIEELLEVGARIRPLYHGDERIGWVRGVHQSERRYLRRYFHDNLEIAEHVIRAGTSLSREYVASLSAIELRNLLRVITEMTNSDLRLYPFIGPFVTTSTSEQIWYSQGTALTAFQKRIVELPDGTPMTLLSAPDQARLWAALCTYRERAKSRLEATNNAVLIVRPWAGKGADGLANDLKAMARSLIADTLDPWIEMVQVKKPIHIDDGWAHGEDDSREGLLREIDGMMNNDRHEQVVAAFESQQLEKAKTRQEKIERVISDRGGPGFIDQKTEIITAAEARARAKEAGKRQSRRPAEDSGSNNVNKLGRYQ